MQRLVMRSKVLSGQIKTEGRLTSKGKLVVLIIIQRFVSILSGISHQYIIWLWKPLLW